MGSIVFLSENFNDQSTDTLTSGTENSQFPLSNLKNESPSQKFRTAGNTCTIQLDLLQTRDLDTFALVGDPLEGFSLTSVVVKTSVNTDFSGSPANNVNLNSNNNFGFIFFTEVSHRFVQIELTGNGSFCQLSNIFIGKRDELEFQNLSINSFIYRNKDNSTTSKNRYGQKFTNKRNLQKVLAGSIEFANKTEQELLDTIFLEKGTQNPVWLIVDKDGNSINDGEYKLSIYGNFEEMPAWTSAGGQLYNTSLSVEAAV